ncbi:MAG: hypothetical protein V1820_00340 [archaeon]
MTGWLGGFREFRRFREILKWQVAEEWRIHTLLFGKVPFLLFPAALFSISLILSILFSVFLLAIPARDFFLGVAGFCIVLGFSVGAFGIFGREILNRRFGQASLVSYSSRILPVSDRLIFLAFILKDSFYYILLWLAPSLLGLGLGIRIFAVVAGAGFSLPGLAALVFEGSLLFLSGMSLSFFLSGVLVKSKAVFLAAVVSCAFFAKAFWSEFLGLISFFPENFSLANTAGFLLAAAILSAGGLVLLENDYAESVSKPKGGKKHLLLLKNLPARFAFVGKDFLDLLRSGGGLGRVIFAFLVPLGAVWYLLSKLSAIAPELPVFLAFAIFTGIVSSSMYNWLTEFDFQAAYSFLPVRKSQLIWGKLSGYAILNVLPVALIVFSGVALGEGFFGILEAVFSCLIFSAYSLSVTVFLTGLEPSLRLYGGWAFAKYSALIAIPSGAFVFLSLVSWPGSRSLLLLLLLLMLVPLSAVLLSRAFRKWADFEETFF